MSQFWNVLVVSLMLAAGTIVADTISCKDELGQNVDWFYAFKLPEAMPRLTGTEFIYLKPGLTSWVQSTSTVDLANSSIGYTISQAYAPASDPNRVVAVYNDEPTIDVDNLNSGHTKGVLVADDTSGFWVIHSVPVFPNVTENPADYAYPSSGHLYGQSYLCISVNADQVNKIGLQLVFNEPTIYAFQISDNLRSLYPHVVDAANMVVITSPPYSNVATITSAGGVDFQSFAKGKNYNADLYEDFMAPTLGEDLYVQSWRVGTSLLSSNCTQPQSVWNVNKLQVVDQNFSTKKDHSKWTVTDPSSPVQWVCVGDMNRTDAQTRKGGGMVCLNSPTIASQYYALMIGFDAC